MIEELLGAGGAGKVYKARHRELRKHVAIKVLHAFYQRDLDFCTRFYGEALAASKLDHPNVLRIVDFGQEPDGMLYIAMEYLEGVNLQRVIDKEGQQRPERIASIMMQVCAALTAAHEKGIVHRDVKPENIVLLSGTDDDGNPTEIVKVCDFGIAQLRNPSEGVLSAAAQRRVAGTPEYMAPEQCRGEELDARADVYACGVTLLELATGRVPFTGSTPMQVVRRQIEEEAPRPSELKADIDPLLEAIILRALEKDPRQRQQSARELRGELRELLEPVMMERELTAPGLAIARREVRDASLLPSLEDEASRFQEFFVALAGAISRTTYYDRGHRESAHALARLQHAAQVALMYRGEISFARRDVGDAVLFSVLTGVGEVHELKKLLPHTIHSMFGVKFGEVFQRRSLVALTIDDGIDEAQLGSMVELLSGPEIGPEELRAQFVAKGLTHAKLLFAADLLGRERKLPWQVDLCISRLARDLRQLPLLRGVDHDAMRALRMQLIADVVRALPKPEQSRSLLENADLIADEVRHIPELAKLDTLRSLVDALARPRAVQVADAIVADARDAALGDRARRVLQELSARFVRERSVESDELLKKMYTREILALETLPADLQVWVHAERMTELLAQRAEQVLRPLEGQIEAAFFEQRMLLLEHALRNLASRGDARAVSIVLAWLRRLQGARAEMAAGVARALEDPAVLAPVGDALFTGTGAARDAAHAALVLSGSAGARALCMARAKRADLDPASRARFLATMRRIGRAAWPTVVSALDGLAQGAAHGAPLDDALAEDLLRVLPDVQDDQIGAIVARVMRAGGPAVCRAAAGALGTLWGPRARPLLVALLESDDDGVRIAALAALRKVGGVDERVVQRIERMMGRATGKDGAGADLRAAAAAALADATPRARPEALAVLERALVPQTKGVLARLRGPGAVDAEPLVVLAQARAILALGGAEGLDAIETRAAYADEPLRGQLLDLCAPRAPR